MPMDVQKYTKGAAYKQIEHAIRYKNVDKDIAYKNKDIDKSKTHENYSIGIDRQDKYGYLKYKVKEYDNIIQPKRIKKDRVYLASFNFAVPESIANTDREKEYFQHCYDWLKKKFGEVNIVYSEVHRDEIHDYLDKGGVWRTSRAHMHAGIIPFTKEKGVHASSLVTRKALTEWHGDLDKYIFEKMGIHDLVHTDEPCGLKTEDLKRESIERAKKERNNIDKEIVAKTNDLTDLDNVYEHELLQIQESIDNAQARADKKIKAIKEDAEKQIKDVNEKLINAEQDIENALQLQQKAKKIKEQANLEMKEFERRMAELKRKEKQKIAESDERVLNAELEANVAEERLAMMQDKIDELDDKGRRMVEKYNRLIDKIDDKEAVLADLDEEIEHATNQLDNILDASEKVLKKAVIDIPGFEVIAHEIAGEINNIVHNVLNYDDQER